MNPLIYCQVIIEKYTQREILNASARISVDMTDFYARYANDIVNKLKFDCFTLFFVC